jgi:ATP-dependent protease ClpP protease subunit
MLRIMMAAREQTLDANVLKFQPRPKDRALNYRVVKAAASSAEIYLYDSIGSWFGISAKQFVADLKALGDVKTIDLHINSDGGDVFDGRAIYSQLAQHKARIVVHVDGIAASIASLIAMAGDEIRMADGAFMMIHNAWGLSIGDAAEMRRMADLLESVNSTIQDTYAARTKQSIADLKTWMDAETWMTGEEAVDRGFADVLDEPVKAAATIREPGRFRNLPSALQPRRAAALARLAALKGA